MPDFNMNHDPSDKQLLEELDKLFFAAKDCLDNDVSFNITLVTNENESFARVRSIGYKVTKPMLISTLEYVALKIKQRNKIN